MSQIPCILLSLYVKPKHLLSLVLPHITQYTVFSLPIYSIPTPIISQLTNHTVHSTIRHLYRTRPNPHGYQPLPHLTQPRRRLNLTPISTLSIFCTAPQYLGSSRCARPDHLVDISPVGLLSPHVRFAADDEMLRCFRHTSKRVQRVDYTPIVEGGTVVFVGIAFRADGRVIVEPFTFAAVEVLVHC
jgi:hypothetical protein